MKSCWRMAAIFGLAVRLGKGWPPTVGAELSGSKDTLFKINPIFAKFCATVRLPIPHWFPVQLNCSYSARSLSLGSAFFHKQGCTSRNTMTPRRKMATPPMTYDATMRLRL